MSYPVPVTGLVSTKIFQWLHIYESTGAVAGTSFSDYTFLAHLFECTGRAVALSPALAFGGLVGVDKM